MAADGRIELRRLGGSGATIGYTLVWDGARWKPASASSGLTVQEEGAALTARAALNFIGTSVTAADDSANSRTNVTVDAAKSTVSPGLPSMSNRSTGDLHNDSTTSKEYVLTGTPGTLLTDTFTRSAASWGSPDVGPAWSGSNASTNGTQGVVDAAGWVYANLGSSNKQITVKADFSYGGGQAVVIDNTTASGTLDGYNIWTIYQGGPDELTFYLRKGTVWLATSAIYHQATDFPLGARTMVLTRSGSEITASITNAAGDITVLLTATDPSPTAGNYVGVANGSVTQQFIADRFDGMAVGTRAWTQISVDSDAQTLGWMTVGS